LSVVQVGAVLSLVGRPGFAVCSWFSCAVLPVLLAAVLFAMGLWGLGDTDFPAGSVQISAAEVRAQADSHGDARGEQPGRVSQMSDTALIDADYVDACESEPVHLSLRPIRCQAITALIFSAVKARESPMLPGPFRPPAA
jgi:hypothetical protein